MKAVEKTARTVEDAIAEALIELDVRRGDVEVEVLDEGTRGLFGLLGGRDARVRVRLKGAPIEQKVKIAETFLQGLLRRMGVEAKVESEIAKDGVVRLNMTGQNLGMVIGRRGQTLDSIQYLVVIVANKDSNEFTRFILDAQGYRKRREETVRSLARRMAAKAREEGRPISLEPMNPLERRYVHLALADFEDVETRSEGSEPQRRVVVVPKKKKA